MKLILSHFKSNRIKYFTILSIFIGVGATLLIFTTDLTGADSVFVEFCEGWEPKQSEFQKVGYLRTSDGRPQMQLASRSSKDSSWKVLTESAASLFERETDLFIEKIARDDGPHRELFIRGCAPKPFCLRKRYFFSGPLGTAEKFESYLKMRKEAEKVRQEISRLMTEAPKLNRASPIPNGADQNPSLEKKADIEKFNQKYLFLTDRVHSLERQADQFRDRLALKPPKLIEQSTYQLEPQIDWCSAKK